MIRRKQQELAALALVRSSWTDAHDFPLPQIGHAAEQAGWRFNHDGTITLQVDRAQSVDRLGIAGQQQRHAVHEVFPQDQLIRHARARLGHALPDSVPGDAVHLHEIRLDGTVEQQGVSQTPGRIRGWIAVLELEVADASLDGFSPDPAMACRHRRGRIRCHISLRVFLMRSMNCGWIVGPPGLREHRGPVVLQVHDCPAPRPGAVRWRQCCHQPVSVFPEVPRRL